MQLHPLVAATVAACLLLVPVSAPAGDAPGKVAAVNGSGITQKDLDRELDLFQKRMAAQGRQVSEEQAEKARKDVLEKMITLELLSQESEKKKIKADPKAVDMQMSQFRQRFPNEEEFEKALKEMDVSEADLKIRVQENLAIKELISREVESGISISDKEAKSFYEERKSAFRQPEQVRARHILAKAGPEDDAARKKSARDKIEAARKRLEAGEDFDLVAREVSEGPSAPQGGDLGFFGRGRMVKPFEDAAFALETGKVSSVVETRFGYHLIQVTDRRPEKALPYEEVEKRLKQVLRQDKLRRETEKYIETLRKSARIERF